ncbi:DUF4268 domain-containing protein [Candidatus Poribacteria bacterium]|nr:DUF4268 domain-containing protein [Candidatus Poribacteria bacterium]
MLKLGCLQPVDLRSIWPTEDKHFTPWLAKEENLNLLGKALNMGLEFEDREVNVGRFRADILCRDLGSPQNEMWVLIENQFGVTNHDHLGKILTYAASLDAHTMIWIAEEFLDEHLTALNQLNKITNKNFQYFGVKIRVWRIGKSEPAPQFDVVSSPKSWHRRINQSAQRAGSEGLSERQERNIKFWTELRDYMNRKNSPVNCGKPPKESFLQFNVGRSANLFQMEAYLATRDRKIGVRFYTGGPDATRHFCFLKKQEEEIEREFGESLEWAELPGSERCRIFLQKINTDPTDEDDWPNQHEWLASKLEKFDKVFRPRVKTLNAADWEHSEYEDDK